MKGLIYFFFMGICIIGCRNQSQPSVENTEPDEYITDLHTAENSLDYFGTYLGVLPGSDGSDTHVILILKGDASFILKSYYLSEPDTLFEEKGDFSIDGNVLTLKSRKGDDLYFKVEENQLRKLDNEKQVVKGNDTEKYVLKKDLSD